ncbi:MAG: hypothetical protein R3D02_11550 [Hyphomicrobiales bacterium]
MTVDLTTGAASGGDAEGDTLIDIAAVSGSDTPTFSPAPGSAAKAAAT